LFAADLLPHRSSVAVADVPAFPGEAESYFPLFADDQHHVPNTYEIPYVQAQPRYGRLGKIEPYPIGAYRGDFPAYRLAR
jgi:hypothetical protein